MRSALTGRHLRRSLIIAMVGALAALAGVSYLIPTTQAVARPARAPRVRAADTSSAVALQWYDITTQTVAAAAFPEAVTQSRAWAVSWLAAAHAVGNGSDPSYSTAAFAQALHDTLAAQVPSQQPQLDGDLASTLATIPDGPDKSAGILAGEQQATAVLAQRAGDGLDTASVDTPFATPAPGPGVWQPTPPSFAPAVRAGEGNARAFLLARNDQFDPGPPPSLTSKTYLRDLAEVQAYGSATSTVRTPQETNIALFWYPALNFAYGQILRDALAETGHSLAWDTRFVATFHVVTTDAQIAVYNAKFKYVFWRPVTAIRTGTVNPDPTWTPESVTPKYPDWPSGHGGYAGAATVVLTAFLGPRAPQPVSLTSPNDPGSTLTYTNWWQITQDIINARVWEGVHFRFSDDAGAWLGGKLALYELFHLGSLGLAPGR
jgi:membrane-associated phospholipid phosphatase